MRPSKPPEFPDETPYASRRFLALSFADQKDEPAANTFALELFRNHDEIAMESVAWHVHGDVDFRRPTDARERH